MILLYESLKKNLANPLYYFLSIGAGLVFTVIFAMLNKITAIKVSVIVFLSIIFFALFIAFITKEKQDVIEIAERIADRGKHKAALKILVKARKKASDGEYCLKIDYEIGVVYCLMEQYQKAVTILREILRNDAKEWTWKVYFQLAKALSYTKGFFSNEVLEVYLSCVTHRKQFDEYGKADFRPDIYLCHEISEIYRVKKNYTESNRWFRDEMVLREAYCDIGTKAKMKELFAEAVALANKKHVEEALRLYEKLAYLIENNIGENCDKYATVQLEMGKLFWNGYETPRHDYALECFLKSVDIKRKYMSDLPKGLSNTFAYALPEMQDLCKESINIIIKLYNSFQMKRSSCSVPDVEDFQSLIDSRNAVIDKCEEVLTLFEEVFSEDSLELAEIYRIIGGTYKWLPCNHMDCVLAANYLEKVAKIWRKYKNNQSIQMELARLLVDLGGTFGIQKDYETELSYRLEALKIVKSIKNIDLEEIGIIELSVKGTYEKTVQSKSVDYNSFLEKNGLASIIESVQMQPLGNGWGNFKVKLQGVKEEYNWKMTLGGRR